MNEHPYVAAREYEEARRRICDFIAARDRHQASIQRVQRMMGIRPTNPLPNLIIAEYGTLDTNDLRMLCNGSDDA